ncbi:MATE family efflux transporter [Sphingomonas sp. RG327]|uniref:MATE family efflux transporter n=1 Tax=Sphingomonas anseongensis TaxID=2908207 RepID=A0ABT0RFT3_9SPHN|nr:MATE family efflux transporter [Sphingomonas anseongensis]MCL6678815.1 MATE family efflux transporter [Sphingomonas anseongensis]
MDVSSALADSRTARLWSAELRATLSLAWPLILANLTQQLIQATDVLLMGWLGATQLAAATLALNLTWTFNLFLFGLVTACSPMMARALGQRSNAVRDVRRTFRAGLWLLVFALPPYWLLLWNVGELMRALGQSEELASQGQTFLRAYMWSTAPWLLFQLLRNFVSALERPRIVLWLSLFGIALNALVSWSLIFGHFGLPALGLVGGGVGTTLTWMMLCAALIAVTSSDRQFRRFHLFGNWWRFDRQRILEMVHLGLPIGITMALEMGVFALAAYFMGWIGAVAVAAHAVALQIAAVTFMVPLGLGQAATVRVGLAAGRRDEAGITRAGWTAWTLGVAFMASMAAVMWAVPYRLVTLFLAESPANLVVIGLAVTFLKVAAAFQLVDGAQVIGAGMLRGLHDTRWPLLFAFVGYWVVGLGIGTWLAFGADWKGLGIWIGLASGLAAVAMLMLVRWVMRDRLGLTRIV